MIQVDSWGTRFSWDGLIIHNATLDLRLTAHTHTHTQTTSNPISDFDFIYFTFLINFT